MNKNTRGRTMTNGEALMGYYNRQSRKDSRIIFSASALLYLLIMLALLCQGCASLCPAIDPRYEHHLAVASFEKGDCDVQSAYLSKSLTEAGLPHEFKIGWLYEEDKRSDGSTIYHAWVEVNKGEDRYVLDPTAGGRGWIYTNPKSHIHSPVFQTIYEAAKVSVARGERESKRKRNENL